MKNVLTEISWEDGADEYIDRYRASFRYCIYRLYPETHEEAVAVVAEITKEFNVSAEDIVAYLL